MQLIPPSFIAKFGKISHPACEFSPSVISPFFVAILNHQLAKIELPLLKR